jgi:hypothetical protein
MTGAAVVAPSSRLLKNYFRGEMRAARTLVHLTTSSIFGIVRATRISLAWVLQRATSRRVGAERQHRC